MRLLRTVTASICVLALAACSSGGPSTDAGDRTTFRLVGTSDVFDSFLVQTVLEPGFEEAYPQYDLVYNSQGSGAAIALAKSGSADALLVHAASLENQLVGDGYSQEDYGRAVFWGDYVVAGGSNRSGDDPDPAQVGSGSPHDAVDAFRRIATAGAAGRAEFVSRGGTPGTTVQEHAIWALTPGVTTCEVSADDGGGRRPATVAGPCPDDGAADPAYPDWYHATGAKQAANVQLADACNGFASSACYLMTDRGTFQYLAGQGSLAHLEILTRDNADTATGGPDLLVNSFHAYAVDPDAFADDSNVTIQSAAATDFLDWVTSPAGQQAVGDYLSEGGDPPFLPSAAPRLTVSAPKVDEAGDDAGDGAGDARAEITGTVTNVVPGTPSLVGETVRLLSRPADQPGAAPSVVATTTTTASGGYTFRYQPSQDLAYVVSVPAITQVEDDALSPVFGDLLAPVTVPVDPSAPSGG